MELRKLGAADVEDVRGEGQNTGSVPLVAKLPDALVLLHDPVAFHAPPESEALANALAASGGSVVIEYLREVETQCDFAFGANIKDSVEKCQNSQ